MSLQILSAVIDISHSRKALLQWLNCALFAVLCVNFYAKMTNKIIAKSYRCINKHKLSSIIDISIYYTVPNPFRKGRFVR